MFLCKISAVSLLALFEDFAFTFAWWQEWMLLCLISVCDGFHFVLAWISHSSSLDEFGKLSLDLLWKVSVLLGDLTTSVRHPTKRRSILISSSKLSLWLPWHAWEFTSKLQRWHSREVNLGVWPFRSHYAFFDQFVSKQPHSLPLGRYNRFEQSQLQWLHRGAIAKSRDLAYL